MRPLCGIHQTWLWIHEDLRVYSPLSHLVGLGTAHNPQQISKIHSHCLRKVHQGADHTNIQHWRNELNFPVWLHKVNWTTQRYVLGYESHVFGVSLQCSLMCGTACWPHGWICIFVSNPFGIYWAVCLGLWHSQRNITSKVYQVGCPTVISLYVMAWASQNMLPIIWDVIDIH